MDGHRISVRVVGGPSVGLRRRCRPWAFRLSCRGRDGQPLEPLGQSSRKIAPTVLFLIVGERAERRRGDPTVRRQPTAAHPAGMPPYPIPRCFPAPRPGRRLQFKS